MKNNKKILSSLLLKPVSRYLLSRENLSVLTLNIVGAEPQVFL